MGLGNWLRKILGWHHPSQEMVPFLDVESGRVVRIPVSELRPGTIQVQLQPSGEMVWALPEQLRQSEVKHPEFDESIRDYIRQIKSAFAEHQMLSFEEGEDGFRRDANPKSEIALWSHAADVYTEFAGDEPDASRREDVYRCIVTCMTTGPQAVWQVFRPAVLNRAEAERLVDRFFGK